MKSDFNGTLSKEKLLWFIAAAGFLLLCGPTFELRCCSAENDEIPLGLKESKTDRSGSKLFL